MSDLRRELRELAEKAARDHWEDTHECRKMHADCLPPKAPPEDCWTVQVIEEAIRAGARRVVEEAAKEACGYCELYPGTREGTTHWHCKSGRTCEAYQLWNLLSSLSDPP